MSNTTASRQNKAGERMDVTGKLPMVGKLFVYGTLKRAYGNNRLLKGAKFLGVAATMERYPMICHSIPFLYNVPGKGNIVMGEVFEVTDPNMMANIDRLESHPHGYRRTPFKVILRDESKQGDPIGEVDVFVYFDTHPFDDSMLSECKAEYDYNWRR